jgi:sec-independent protein translocase protein TatA
MPSIGPLELVIVLVIVLIVFGPKRLPGLGRQLGTGMREFKDSITRRHDDDDDNDDDEKATVRRQQIDAAAAEAEVVTGEARPQDQPTSRADVS